MDLHCMICQQVYYEKERIWIDIKTYKQYRLGKASTSIYHRDCLEHYFREYVKDIPEHDKQQLRDCLERRLQQIKK